MHLEVRILDDRLLSWGFPTYGSPLAAGLDLFACIDSPLRLSPQAKPQLISSGVALRIGRRDWCALIVPRSGLGHREGLVLGNTIGVVDGDYTGPCLISAWNRNPPEASSRRRADIIIHPGDRIAQLVLTRIARPTFRIVSEFSGSTHRGDRGLGSTGVSPPGPGRKAR